MLDHIFLFLLVSWIVSLYQGMPCFLFNHCSEAWFSNWGYLLPPIGHDLLFFLVCLPNLKFKMSVFGRNLNLSSLHEVCSGKLPFSALAAVLVFCRKAAYLWKTLAHCSRARMPGFFFVFLFFFFALRVKSDSARKEFASSDVCAEATTLFYFRLDRVVIQPNLFRRGVCNCQQDSHFFSDFSSMGYVTFVGVRSWYGWALSFSLY